MRFLLDQNQSPLLVGALTVAGHDAVHVRDLAMSRATDREILEYALQDQRIVLSSDTDFGELRGVDAARTYRWGARHAGLAGLEDWGR